MTSTKVLHEPTCGASIPADRLARHRGSARWAAGAVFVALLSAGCSDGGRVSDAPSADAGSIDGGGDSDASPPPLSPGPDLAVDSTGRHLVRKSTGEPFFFLSDTAWGLFSLAPTEVEWYLRRRAEQGFTAVSIGNVFPNYYRQNYAGDEPFPTGDVTQPNEAFFGYLDWIIDAAAAHGLVVSIRNLGHRIDQSVAGYYPEEAMHLAPTQARGFGEWLGARWRNKRNLIVSGGQDVPALRTDLSSSDPPDQRPYWRAQAEGWVMGVTGQSPTYDERHAAWNDVVMTWHPPGAEGSSTYFHDDSWLTVNMNQSWTFADHYGGIERDWDLAPAKPTFFGESVYEGASHGDVDGTVARNIRAQAWVSVLAGGFGYTYGAEGVYFFDGAGGQSWQWLVDNNEAGQQLVHLRKLIESRPMLERAGPRDLVVSPGGPSLTSRVQGGGSGTRSYAFIYFPRADISSEIRAGTMSGGMADAWWYSPRDGLCYDNGGGRLDAQFATYSTAAASTVTFDPPGADPLADWVLVLDDSIRSFGVPGQ